jgi:hypothetical protein
VVRDVESQHCFHRLERYTTRGEWLMLSPCRPRGGEHNKDLDVEKFVADAADVSLAIDYHKHTDAVFDGACNKFYRIVVL